MMGLFPKPATCLFSRTETPPRNTTTMVPPQRQLWLHAGLSMQIGNVYHPEETDQPMQQELDFHEKSLVDLLTEGDLEHPDGQDLLEDDFLSWLHIP